jgi:hypothetical protein
MGYPSTRSRFHKDTMRGAEQRIYIANGYDKMFAWDGVRSSDMRYAGISGPVTNPTLANASVSGSIAAGTHGIRWRYLDKATGYYSNPSGEGTISAPGNEQMSIAGMIALDGDFLGDKIIVEMTEADGSVFYEATEISATVTSANFDIDDTTLAAADTYDADGHDMPPQGRCTAYVKSRMFVGAPQEHTAGRASTTGSSTAVTFSAADVRAGLVGYMFHIGASNNAEVEIASITSATEDGSLALASVYPSAYTSQPYIARPTAAARNSVYFSKALHPEAFKLTTDYVRVLEGGDDELQGLIGWRSALLVFGSRSMEVFAWEVDPGDTDDGRLYPIPGGRGAVCQEVLAENAGVIYSMDYQGMFAYDEEVRPLSDSIQDVIKGINFARADRFHAHWDPETDQYVVFVCFGDDDYPQTALAYTPADGSWDIWRFDSEFVSSFVAPDAAGRMRAHYVARDGDVLFPHCGYADGMPPDYSVVGTVISSTVSQTTVSEELYKGGSGDMERVKAYWVEGGEVASILDNTSSTVNYWDGFTSAPAVGDTLRFGRINAIHRSPEFRIGAPDEYQKELALVVQFEPLLEAKTLYCRVYENGSAAPKADWNANTNIAGVTFTTDNQDIQIDVSLARGFVEIPLGDVWHKSLVVEFELKDGNIPLTLLGYHIEAETEELIER